MQRARPVVPALFGAAVLLAATLAATPSVQASPASKHLQMCLSPTGATPSAQGMVKYTSIRTFRHLIVDTHGLAPGSYDILIGGGAVGSMDVLEGVNSGDDAGRFVIDSRFAGMLIFDPRGTSVEVVNQETGETELALDDFPSSKREEMERTKVASEFRNAEVQLAASGKAEFRSFRGRARFRVTVAGLAPGRYDLNVGGSSQALLSVSSLNEIEVSFDTTPPDSDDPQREDDAKAADDGLVVDGSRRLLTFDPRGFAVSIAQGGVDVLVIKLFPY